MGMFDCIRFEYKLPKFHSLVEFQTKDTPAQCMENYRVSESGQLMLNGEKVDFSGDINFYANIENKGRWEQVEYQSIFWEGKLQKVKRINKGE